MKNKFYTWIIDFGNLVPRPYDILPYLSQEWKKLTPKSKREATKDLQSWVDRNLKYQYWGRCEYEFLILPWPNKDTDEPTKIDIYQQCVPNLSLITRLFAENERID